MADSIGIAGKIGAMTGLRALIASVKLYNSVGGVVDTASISTPTSDFSIDAAGQLSNAVAIDFTIAAGDVGDTAASVDLIDAAGTGILLRIDLDTNVPLTTEGTATFAIGDLTADL